MILLLNTVATLNVTGIDNIVNSTNFNNFFDNNILMNDIPFDEIFFEGSFENMGVLTINKTITITGINASLNNTVFKIIADNVSLNNFTLTSSKNYVDSDNACIYIGGNNVIISNSNFTCSVPDNQESYVIIVDVADNVSIISNNIKYSAKSEGDVKTIAVNVVKANNFKFENNLLNADIPSVNIGYASTITYFSQAIHVENSDIVSIKNNTVSTSYSNVEGAYDTIYVIHATASNNTSILDNKIKLDGNNYAYAVVSDGKNIIISNNEINVTSADCYACAININSDSTGVIKDNNITAISVQVSYPVYIDDWFSANPSEVNVTGNSIYGNSTNVYAVYIQANKSSIA